jgi:hypothetical protein
MPQSGRLGIHMPKLPFPIGDERKLAALRLAAEAPKAKGR